jgi:transcription antitermination protein NusB
VTRRRSGEGEDLRSEARERALGLLYEAETKSISPQAVLDAQIFDQDELTRALIEGVAQDQTAIDGLISEHAKGWTLARMPAVDRAVLRLAICELQRRPETPTAVIIDEAVELAKRFSTDDSGRFVNGMLSAIARKVRSSA